MTMKLLPILAVLVVPPVAADAAEPSHCVPVTLSCAQEEYERGHWANAFEQLKLLADQGSAAAARMAFDMVRFGRPLFGAAFDATG